MASASDNLAIVKKILTEATDIICDNLDPEILLRTMKTKGALTDNDVSYIRAKITTDDKAEQLLSILMKKPVESYDIFMETLVAKERKDLYAQIKNIEMRHGYVKAGEAKDRKPAKQVSDLKPSHISDVIDQLSPDELTNLYEKLDISYREVEKAHQKANTTDPDQRAKTVLRRWQENSGSKATRQAILDALKAARYINSMEALQDLWSMGAK
ncbi:uncharacterized protein [Amphiura filiformis]|uniref:uncharacterized protein n=1 Tax=Amphiura filiformis TaxID=82378 RepID=UPI003B21691B